MPFYQNIIYSYPNFDNSRDEHQSYTSTKVSDNNFRKTQLFQSKALKLLPFQKQLRNDVLISIKNPTNVENYLNYAVYKRTKNNRYVNHVSFKNSKNKSNTNKRNESVKNSRNFSVRLFSIRKISKNSIEMLILKLPKSTSRF